VGLYISLTPVQTASLRQQILDRINIGLKTVDVFSGFLSLKRIEIWLGLPFEGDGTKAFEQVIETDNFSAPQVSELVKKETAAMRIEELHSSIILLKCVWKFGEELTPGYISINNAWKWRKIYGDIEVDAYPSKEDWDFSDMVLTGRDAGETLFYRLVGEVKELKPKAVHLNSISMFQGLLSKSEIFNAKALYYPKQSELVKDLLRSYKEELKEKKDRRFRPHLTPFDNNFLVTSLWKNKIFRMKLDKQLTDSNIITTVGHSAFFAAKDKDSFVELYNDVKKGLFEPISLNLPNTRFVKSEIRRALAKDTVLPDSE